MLVDDRQDAILEHHFHAGTLVLITAFALEVLFCREHLSHVYVVFAKQVVVEVDELHLSHCREELTLFDWVERMVNLQFSPSTRNCTTRDKHHIIVLLPQPSNLINKRRDSRDVEFAPVCREDIAAHLHYKSFLHCSPALRQRITAELKAAWSNSFSPFIVMPPGVVTLSMAASGCRPVSLRRVTAPCIVCMAICLASSG